MIDSHKSGASSVHRNDLLDAIVAAPPSGGELLYVARHGDEYVWERIPEGAPASPPSEADAWIFYGGTWPTDDPVASAALFEDLLAEMESMTGGIDRCRWPLDEPWPHGH